MAYKHYCIVAIALSAWCLAPAHVEAEPGNDAGTVPRELLEALFAGTGKGKPDILVGKLPEKLAPSLAGPDEWRILGSLVWEDAALIAAISSDKPSAAQAAYVRELSQRPAWHLVEGFDDQSDSVSPEPLLFCGTKGAYMLVSVAPREDDASYIRLQYDDGSNHSPCRGPANGDGDRDAL